ncbi:hypothetical protein [Georgenia sp. SUBG003]|uniref:hypothetical protein n=1 Tax=Georgenia sp. SUBG003 TaxID=1497974 RepID=UPI000AA21B8B
MIDLHHRTQSESTASWSPVDALPDHELRLARAGRELQAAGLGRLRRRRPDRLGHIGKYVGGTANTIGRNGIAAEYGIATLLFEMRGMADHEGEWAILGQKSNGYLIRQTVVTLEATARAIADGSIETADTSFWDTLPEQQTRQ